MWMMSMSRFILCKLSYWRAVICIIIGWFVFCARPTPRFTRAGRVWVWSRGRVYYGADVVGGCKELSAGGDSCLCLTDCRREFFIAADAWKNTRNGVGCNSLLGRSSVDVILQNWPIMFLIRGLPS
jgi:hypothetical protein